jgi:hypothetical protein
MLVLGVGQRAGTVEPIVEVWVQMVDLMREHRTKRTTIDRESPVPLLHVVAVRDRSGDGAIRVGGNARLNTWSVLPARSSTTVAERACSLRQLRSTNASTASSKFL